MMSDMLPDRDDPRADPIYRWIRKLMLLDVALGLGFALFGWFADRGEFVVTGIALAAIGAVLWFLFGALAAHRARQRGNQPPGP